ncbi:spore germination protein [Salicibibacter halophilus]|uniref:Spore germination protein n=2 Tax=Salicibibacter halophilus TaxID=2502791 RepID=A0A514LIZ2_9BACI|nr:spore germination protein [Salicibibacter halophilus]
MYIFMKRKYRAKSKKIDRSLYKELFKNIEEVKAYVGCSADLVVRHFFLGKNQSKYAAIIYMDGMVDLRAVEELMAHSDSVSIDRDVWAKAQTYFEQFGEITEIEHFQKMLNHLLQGHAICIVDGFPCCIGVDISQWAERQIEESNVEKVIRGPKEAFLENVRVNTSLIRRRLNDENLWFESRTLGKRTKTKVVLGYLNGVADEAVLAELRTRLDRINTDAINSGGELEELIQDQFYTPFPTVYSTERPDTVTSQILEGKIAIMVDGTPFVLVVPALMVQFFQSAEDYAQRADIGSAIRLLRYLSVLFALLTPSLYIAFTTYHQELIPFNLLVSLTAQSEV